MRRIALVALASLTAAAGSAQATTHKHPAGAVKLGANLIASAHGGSCGYIGHGWVAGTRLPGGWFISYAQLAKNAKHAAAHAKGKAKGRALAQARSYAKKAAKAKKACPKTAPASTNNKQTTSPVIPPSTPPASTPTGTPLKFNLGGAAGLALKSSSSRSLRQATTGSNLETVSQGGQVQDAVSSGTAQISKFLIAPNNKIYVLFQTPENLDTSQPAAPGAGCILALVDNQTGTPTCVDSSLSQIWWGTNYTPPLAGNAAIQFDSTGAVYYAGYTTDGKLHLRKWDSGTMTELIPSPTNSTLADFLVLPSGNVFITGTDAGNSAGWTRLVSGGALHTIVNSLSYFMHVFPDGDVYLGIAGAASNLAQAPGSYVRRVAPDGTIDPKYWIADSQHNTVSWTTYYDTVNACPGGGVHSDLCPSASYLKYIFNTTDNNVFAVGGGASGSSELVKLYDGATTDHAPTDATFFPAGINVADIKVASAANTNLFLSGIHAAEGTDDPSGVQHLTTLYNTSNGTETRLIGPGSPNAGDYDIYHLNYVAGTNRLMFDALRFSDNAYVIGQVDLSSPTKTLSAVTTGKWSDFETFN